MVVVTPDDPEREFVVGTTRAFTCTASVTNVDDITLMANFTWYILSSSFHISGMQNTSQYEKLSNITSSLSINLLDERIYYILWCNVCVYFSGHLVTFSNYISIRFQCKCNIF